MITAIKSWFRGIFQPKTFKKIDLKSLLEEKREEDIFIPVNRIIEQFNKDKPTILIIDDSKGICSIVKDYLREIIDFKHYNIISFFGTNAGFVMKKTLKELELKGLEKIDYAIIDIILPGRLLVDSEYKKMDGIDVSFILNEEYRCDKFRFFSGNTLNYYVDYMEEKRSKFFEEFGTELDDYIIYKNFPEELIKLAFKELLKDET